MNQPLENTPAMLVIGATSAIAQATARRYADKGWRLFLTGRDPDKLASVAADLQTRGAANVATRIFQATDYADHESLLTEARETLGDISLALLAFGNLPDQTECESDAALARTAMEVNFVSAITLLTPLANHMEQQGHGTVAVISSVAGDRGRRSNYVYGSAKAGLTAFCDGMQIRLAKAGVHLLVIKPGLVATPMTATMEKGPIWAEPQRVGRDIERAVEKRKRTLYTPGFWRIIMGIIKLMPATIFARLPL